MKDNRSLLATLFCLLVTMWVSSAQHSSFPRPLCPHSRLLSGPAPPGYIYCDCERCIISWGFVGGDVTCDPLVPAMDGIHPKFVLSKRFPVHAAIEQLNLHALKVRQFFMHWPSHKMMGLYTVNVLAAGPADAHLRRQVPLWKEAHHHRHLRVAPGNK